MCSELLCTLENGLAVRESESKIRPDFRGFDIKFGCFFEVENFSVTVLLQDRSTDSVCIKPFEENSLVSINTLRRAIIFVDIFSTKLSGCAY